MGTVYEAEHVEIGKRVAIKVLHAVPRSQEEAAARFLREARAASKVESQHVIQVFDVGDEPEVGLFMVMDLLRGEDLEKLVAFRGRLPAKLASAIIAQACLALERAHGVGIVHRDLKPANVFLARVDDGTYQTKIVDFGIAKLVRDATRTHNLDITREGFTIGTPQYMSPEQARGQEAVDRRTDVYSLGAVFYETLTGEPAVPPLASYEATIVHIVTSRPPRVSERAPDVPLALDQLVAEMMAPDADDRLPTASQVRERLLAIYPDLEAVRITLGGSGDVTPPILLVPSEAPNAMEGVSVDGNTEREARPAYRRRPFPLAAGLALLGATFIGGLAAMGLAPHVGIRLTGASTGPHRAPRGILSGHRQDEGPHRMRTLFEPGRTASPLDMPSPDNEPSSLAVHEGTASPTRHDVAPHVTGPASRGRAAHAPPHGPAHPAGTHGPGHGPRPRAPRPFEDRFKPGPWAPLGTTGPATEPTAPIKVEEPPLPEFPVPAETSAPTVAPTPTVAP